MEFLLHRDHLGIKKFDLLVRNGKFERKTSSFLERTTPNRIIIPSREYWEICKLYNLPYRRFPPKNFEKAYKTLLDVSREDSSNLPKNFPWAQVIPKTLYNKELKSYVNLLIEDFSGLKLDYYFGTYKRHSVIFNALDRSAINLSKYNEFINDGNEATSKNVLKTFYPIYKHENVNFASEIEYDRLSSITGRLTVKEGPNILHLRKDYRSILTSKWGDDGSVFYFDFKSLEPRILLALKNKDKYVPKELYSASQFGTKEEIERKLIKTCVISMMYGSSDDELIKKIKQKVDYPEDFISSIKSHFGVDSLRKQLKEEYEKNSHKFIYNFYNRPIFADGVPPYVLVNYFIQSTAVDVALHGFSNIIERLMKTDGFKLIRPLFILHDALIMDVHNKVSHLLPKIAKSGSIGIPGFENTRFWIDVQKLE